MEIQIENGSGWFNLTPYVKIPGGWKVKRNDVEGPNAGRNISASMIRDRIATKYTFDVSCIPMISKPYLDIILSVIDPESFRIRYKDEGANDWTYRNVYTNNFAWSYLFRRGGVEYYDGLSFTLVEM